MSENIFEKASRRKLRFGTNVGLLSVEDLWDLPLTEGKVNLNDLAKSVNKLIKDDDEDFVKVRKRATKEESDNKLRLEILKRIIEVRVEEKERKEKALERKREKELIANIITEKQNEELKNKSIEELKKMIEE